MNQTIAATRKPQITNIALPGRRLWHKLRFVAGIAITLAGVGVLLTDLVSFISSFD